MEIENRYTREERKTIKPSDSFSDSVMINETARDGGAVWIAIAQVIGVQLGKQKKINKKQIEGRWSKDCTAGIHR